MDGLEMLLSLSWIFDHIEGERSSVNVPALIAKFNTHTAEIETFHQLSLNPNSFELVRCEKQDNNTCISALPDGTIVLLPPRSDAKTNLFYIVKKDSTVYSWATMEDFGKNNDTTLFPPMSLPQAEFTSKSWKKYLPTTDIIVNVDNKSLTNRPDMWGHHGFAREIAFLLNMKFKDTAQLLGQIVCHRENLTGFTADEFSLQNDVPQVCTAFSLTKFKQVENTATHPMLALRLATIGQKSIDALVDLTNYVMHDWGHPVHAFDADKITSSKIKVRFAQAEECATLLDGSEITLTPEDLVLSGNAHSNKPQTPTTTDNQKDDKPVLGMVSIKILTNNKKICQSISQIELYLNTIQISQMSRAIFLSSRSSYSVT